MRALTRTAHKWVHFPGAHTPDGWMEPEITCQRCGDPLVTDEDILVIEGTAKPNQDGFCPMSEGACSACEGDGYYGENRSYPCGTCGGTGRTTERRDD